MACFWKKIKTIAYIAVLRTFSKKTLFEHFELLDAQKMCFGAWGQIDPNLILLTLFTIFQKHFLLPKWPYQWSGALVQCSCRRISMRSFSNCQEKWFSLFSIDLNNFMVSGLRFLGVMGPFIFWDVLKICFMAWDLSRSVPRVFRSPGNPLIKLFHFSFLWKYHFLKSQLLYTIAYWIADWIAYWFAYWIAYCAIQWVYTIYAFSFS